MATERPVAWVGLGQPALQRRDYVSMAEALVEGGATLDPRYLGGAAGPLLEWLELRVPESFERQLGDRVTKRLKSLRSLRSRTL